MNRFAVSFLAGAAFLSSAVAADLAKRVKADFGDYGSRSFVHYAVPAMSEEQRLPDAYPADGKPDAPVKIFAAKGEYEPGAFNVWGTKDLGKVKFEIGTFKNEKGQEFPKENLDLKLVKCWYQNLNGWFSYFPDSGDYKLCPELLLNDEDLIRCDAKKRANYARITDEKGGTHEQWINPPRLMDQVKDSYYKASHAVFQPMAPGFEDAAELKPVALPKEQFRNFFLTVKTTKDTPAGVYRGSIQLKQSNNQNNPNNQTILGSIPVEIRVADYELPHPKCYREQDRDFLVCFYHYLTLDCIACYNGGDFELALRQLKPILRDCAEHGQSLHCSGQHFSPEMFRTLDYSIEVGMRPDVFMISPLLWGKREERRLAAFRCANELDRHYGHHDVYFLWGDEPTLHFTDAYREDMEDWKPAGFKFAIAGEECVYRKVGYSLDWANIAFDPANEQPRLLGYWNKQADSRVAWYARQHVGAENPALHRRQNGLGAWLTGYNCLCNYAHHLGPYNDDSEYYKPMVYAYGTHNGVIDTIAWEGFREGIDDIRYATLLLDLARKARASGDLKARDLGGLAIQYLSLLAPAAYDANTARAEMRGYIDLLLAVVKADPVVPFRRPAAKPDAAEAAFKAELAPIDKALAAAKPAERGAFAKKLSDAYRKFFRHEDRISRLEKEGFLEEAAGAAADNFEYKRAGDHYLALAKDGAARPASRAAAAWKALKTHPEIFDDASLAKLLEPQDARTNSYVDALWGTWGRLKNSDYLSRDQWRTWKRAYALAAKAADSIGRKGLPPAVAQNGLRVCALTGDRKLMKAIADRVLSDEKAKPADRYQASFVCGMFAEDIKRPFLFGSREKSVASRAEELEKEFAKDIPVEARVAAINRAGTIANELCDEDMVRGLESYRASLYKPAPRRQYAVKFSEKPLLYAQDAWAEVEKAVCDRKFGGSTELMDSDVTTGGRTIATGTETLPPMSMQIGADEWGVHFRFWIPDPKARQIGARQIGGGTFEGYLAPGKNRPYVCFLKDDASAQWRFFNSVYSACGQSAIDGKNQDLVRSQVVFGDDGMVQMMSLSWDNFVDDLPRDGSIWDFEPLYWGRAGDNSWNGVKTIHGRSTWGELAFELSDADRARILRGVEARAYARFRREVIGAKRLDRYEGCARHWNDKVVGDVEFFNARVKPFTDGLVEAGEVLAEDPSDKTILRLEENGTLSKWHNVFFLLDRMRHDWLTR